MSTAIGSGASKELRHAYDRVNFFFWTMSATTWQRGGKGGDFDAKKVASLFIVDVVVNAQREETKEEEEEDTSGLANSSEDAAR
jgi:hypothetical protein